MNRPNAFVVDFVAHGVRPNEWRVVLVEQGPWLHRVDENLRRLQERLYECIDAALDGQLAAKFPDSIGKSLIIQVDGYGLPHDEVVAFFARFSEGVLQTDDYRSSLAGNRFVSDIGFELNLRSTQATKHH